MTTRARRSIKQEKEEKEESTEEEESKTEEETKDESVTKTKARAKLNKALEKAEEANETAEKSESSEDFDEEAEEEEEEEIKVPKKVIKKEKTAEIKAPKAVAKAQAQASYIMKLFDRSVNLAKFEETTPLYPLCRAWMANNPRSLPLKETEQAAGVVTVQEGDVVEMPKVRVRKTSQTSKTSKESKLDKAAFDKTIETEKWTKEKLLSSNILRWQEIRQAQIENSRNFEEKHFSANLELLMSLQKGSDE